jgi:hypothetical protein
MGLNMNYSKYVLYILIVLQTGCAAYKELEPVPQISFLESEYIELIDEDEKFELDEGKKYFIRFPKPVGDKNYLVLNFKEKSAISSYLTRAFDDGEGTVIPIEDMSEDPGISSVYPLDKTVPTFFWVIEEVRQDFILDMTYRYVAIWRYKFEKKHAQFQQVLDENTQSRKILEEIGKSIQLSDVDFTGEKQSAAQKTQMLDQVNKQLHEIEAILPPEILNSDDQAYQDYLVLKKNIGEELEFQSNYTQVMDMLEVINSPKPDIEKFVTFAPAFSALLTDTTQYSKTFHEAVKKDLNRTLPMVVPYYEGQLKNKKDSTPISIDLNGIQGLYAASNISPKTNLGEMSSFIETYNERAKSLEEVKVQLKTLNTALMTEIVWPTNSLYSNKRADLSKIKSKVPPSETNFFGTYKSYTCVKELSKSINSINNDIQSLDYKFQRAAILVPQINTLRQQGNFSEILRILKENSDLTFLSAQYKEIDELSMTQHRQAISRSLRANDFSTAENEVRKFDQDTNFLNPKQIMPQKNKLVRAYEDSLVNKIETVSLKNANDFIQANKTTFDLVDSLYSNPALYPAHVLIYGTTPVAVLSKNKQIAEKMSYLRYHKFPETAIEALYRSFADAIHVQGVEKARAVVIHGGYYQGENSKFNNLVAECDPTASKWVTKPKDYRKLYALPITSNLKGSNQYMVKINLQIPSEAKFPVYDINVKLPQEVAKHSGSKQWYDTIYFNKKVLKNEGRFTITAPDPDNDYIAQITPLQVNTTGNNIIEIRFDYNAFKVLEISVMAQKPIIKKN